MITNGSFETAGASPDQASGWTWTINAVAERAAAFSLVTLSGTDYVDAESFENGDGTYLFAFSISDVVAPLFDTSVSIGDTAEDFEEGWSANQSYSFDMSSTDPAAFDSALTPEAIEDYEEGWSANESYAFVMGSTSAASFDSALTPEAFEDYEEGWRSNESYAFAMGSTAAASFDAGGTPEAFEDFEECSAPIVVVGDSGTDLFNAVGHGLSNGERVTFESTELLPDGIGPETSYYVISSAANTFQVSYTAGGSAVNLGTPGTGTVYVLRDPSRFWRSFLS